eukprot:6111538-Pleurochrysis_carterae.AAC.1
MYRLALSGRARRRDRFRPGASICLVRTNANSIFRVDSCRDHCWFWHDETSPTDERARAVAGSSQRFRSAVQLTDVSACVR